MTTSKGKEIVVYGAPNEPTPFKVFPPPWTSFNPSASPPATTMPPSSSPCSVTIPESLHPCSPPQSSPPLPPTFHPTTTTPRPRRKTTCKPPQKLSPKHPQPTPSHNTPKPTPPPPTRWSQRIPLRKIPKPTQFVDLDPKSSDEGEKLTNRPPPSPKNPKKTPPPSPKKPKHTPPPTCEQPSPLPLTPPSVFSSPSPRPSPPSPPPSLHPL